MTGASGTRVAFLSQGIASGGNFLLSVLLVRALGLDGFGVVSLVLIGGNYAAGIGQALVCQPMLSLAPRVDGDERVGRVRDGVWLAVGLAGVAAVVAWLGLMSVGAGRGGLGGFRVPVGWVAALAGLRVLAPVLRGALFTLSRGWATMTIDLVASWGPCAGVVLLGLMGEASVVAVLQVLVLSAGVAALLGLGALRDLGAGGLPGRGELARHWRSGRWLAGTQAFSWFGTGGLHAATAAVLGPAAVGAIRAAQSLVGLLLVACQALELALPGLAAGALESGGRARLQRWCRARVLKLGIGFAVLGGALGLFGPSLSHWLFPTVDAGMMALALGGLAWLPMASAVGGVLQVAFRAVEDTRPIFTAYAVSSVMSGALALPIVHAFGLAGAAWGFTGTQALFALLLHASMASRTSRRTVAGSRSVSIRHS